MRYALLVVEEDTGICFESEVKEDLALLADTAR